MQVCHILNGNQGFFSEPAVLPTPVRSLWRLVGASLHAAVHSFQHGRQGTPCLSFIRLSLLGPMHNLPQDAASADTTVESSFPAMCRSSHVCCPHCSTGWMWPTLHQAGSSQMRLWLNHTPSSNPFLTCRTCSAFSTCARACNTHSTHVLSTHPSLLMHLDISPFKVPTRKTCKLHSTYDYLHSLQPSGTRLPPDPSPYFFFSSTCSAPSACDSWTSSPGFPRVSPHVEHVLARPFPQRTEPPPSCMCICHSLGAAPGGRVTSTRLLPNGLYV